MTVRDELERVIRTGAPDADSDVIKYMSLCATFIDNYGPALLEVLDRYSWVRNVEGVTLVNDPDNRLYHDAADRALDTARRGGG